MKEIIFSPFLQVTKLYDFFHSKFPLQQSHRTYPSDIKQNGRKQIEFRKYKRETTLNETNSKH